ARPAQCELPQPHAQTHAVLVVAVEQARRDEVVDDAMGGGRGQFCPPPDLRRGLHGAIDRERLEHTHEAFGHRVAGRRIGHAIRVPCTGSLGIGDAIRGGAVQEAGEGVLARAMRVLQCFTDDEPALSAAEIAARTGLPSSTLHRLLATLTEYGLLTRARRHRYTIGARLWELGEL